MLFNPNANTTKSKGKEATMERKTNSFLSKRMVQVRNASEILAFMPGMSDVVLINTLNAFSAFDYVLYMQKRFGTLDELVVSTYNMSERVVNSFVSLVKAGHILQADIVINNKYREAESDRAKFEEIETLTRRDGRIRLHFAQNHTKNILIRTGTTYWVWFGSGNASSNAEKEDYIWMQGKDVFDFKRKNLLDENN